MADTIYIPVYASLDLKGNPILGAALEALAAPPDNPAADQYYFDTTTKRLRIYVDGEWMDASGEQPATLTTPGVVIIGTHLSVDKDGRTWVVVADVVEEDNEKPVTSGAVYLAIKDMSLTPGSGINITDKVISVKDLEVSHFKTGVVVDEVDLEAPSNDRLVSEMGIAKEINAVIDEIDTVTAELTLAMQEGFDQAQQNLEDATATLQTGIDAASAAASTAQTSADTAQTTANEALAELASFIAQVGVEFGEVREEIADITLSAGDGISITDQVINVNTDGSSIKLNAENELYADIDHVATADYAATADSATVAVSANTAQNAVSAQSAARLATARSITLEGDVEGTAVFDGHQDITIETVVKGGSADVPIATTTTAGKVKPDGSTISVDADGTIRATGQSVVESANKWTTPRKITFEGDVTGEVTLDGSVNVGAEITVSHAATADSAVTAETATTAASAVTANTANNAGEASKLATARNIRTNLASTLQAAFDGQIDVTPGVQGVLQVANGGTGTPSITGIIKGNGANSMTVAVPGTDYVTPAAMAALPTILSGTADPTSAQGKNGDIYCTY